MASEAVHLLRTFYEQGNPNGKLLLTIPTSRQKPSELYKKCVDFVKNKQKMC